MSYHQNGRFITSYMIIDYKDQQSFEMTGKFSKLAVVVVPPGTIKLCVTKYAGQNRVE